MNVDEPNDVERSLARLTPKPIPSGLRKRVMTAAQDAHRAAVWTPRMSAVAVACSIMIFAALGADRLVGRHEASRLTALFDGRPTAEEGREGTSDLRELLSGLGSDADIITAVQAMAASAAQWDGRGRSIEARKMLERWLKNETYENIN